MHRASLIQVVSQAALSAASVLLPVFAVALGASLFEVGLIAAAFGLAQLVSSFVGGRAADVHGRRRILQIGLATSAVAALFHTFARTPLELGLARVVLGVAAGLIPAALLSLAYDQNRKLGRFAAWGSLGFGLGALAGGVIGGAEGVFTFSSILLATAFAVSLRLPTSTEPRVAVPMFPREVIERNLPAYAAVVVRHIGATAVWVLLPLHMVALGADLVWVGAASGVNALFQFLIMPRLDGIRSTRLVTAGLLLSALTFVVLHEATTPLGVLAAQPILAASWAALYMGALKFVMERNHERATATGLLQSSIQLSSVAGPLLGGAIAAVWGIHTTMLVAAILPILAIPLFRWELARHPSTTIDPFGRPTPTIAKP
ncbi:MAG TPA: MFS transporter [Candidatus Thermoplasmatota archaeon]|nr:MFS transporter [Candidatus Thermoplasmatota archaeon]